MEDPHPHLFAASVLVLMIDLSDSAGSSGSCQLPLAISPSNRDVLRVSKILPNSAVSLSPNLQRIIVNLPAPARLQTQP